MIGARTSQYSYSIDCDYIQTHAIGYDQYDSTDYTMYLLIERHANTPNVSPSPSITQTIPSRNVSPSWLPSQSQSPSESLSPSPSFEIEVEPRPQIRGFNIIEDEPEPEDDF